MTNHESVQRKQWNALGLVAIAITIVVVLFSRSMGELNTTISDLNEIQSLNATAQRCIRMVLQDDTEPQLVYHIGNQTEIFLSEDSVQRLSVLSHTEEFGEIATQVLNYWENIYDLIQDDIENDNLDTDVFQLVADAHFNSMTSLSNGINTEIEELNTLVVNLQYTVFGLFLVIGAIMVNNFLQTTSAIKQNKELAKMASIDTATGLFNRSKCQELFTYTTKTSEKEYSAIIVIDLNDLKTTNDVLGHRVGDELIYSFASVLKETCNIHRIKPFVGRYGGDEFVVYYKNVKDESDILAYLKELDYLISEFNKNERKFSISYAAGYSLNTPDIEERSVRELFDIADGIMYKNKQYMKRQLKEQAEEQKNVKAIDQKKARI